VRASFAYVQGAYGPTDGPVVESYLQAQTGTVSKIRGTVCYDFDQRKSTELLATGRFDCVRQEWRACFTRPEPWAIGRRNFPNPAAHTISPRKGASGEYELHIQDGRIEKDRFDATWYAVKQLRSG
jgi:hypothetical protein